MHSPAAVLRSIAHRLGCGYGDIERVVNTEMGGESIAAVPDPELRLAAIRRKLLTPEGCSVIEQASQLRAPK
jgi:hypothetical protein